MEAESFNRALRAFVSRKPFRSFRVELSSDGSIEVEHPEALVFRAGVAVHIAADGAVTLFDHQSVSRLSDPVDSTA